MLHAMIVTHGNRTTTGRSASMDDRPSLLTTTGGRTTTTADTTTGGIATTTADIATTTADIATTTVSATCARGRHSARTRTSPYAISRDSP